MTKSELLKLLKKARKQLKKYHVPIHEQTVTLSIDTLENALTEQPQIVRCKDCKHSELWYGDKSRCFLWHETGIDVFNDGFCNYGEKKTDDE